MTFIIWRQWRTCNRIKSKIRNAKVFCTRNISFKNKQSLETQQSFDLFLITRTLLEQKFTKENTFSGDSIPPGR